MIALVDASTLINLVNGGLCGRVLELPDITFAVGPQVLEECKRQRASVDELLAKGLRVLSDDNLPASLFFSLLSEHELGLGETECLALAIHTGGSVCTDDRKARKMCGAAIGSERVLGTAKLLRLCVLNGIIGTDEALGAYELMRSKGAFLPDVPHEFFIRD